ncbi:MAG: hypothetical protein EA402_12545 [Planctomycetota bacterium]|nr:MAG: hypothetical protein EA402_12545 [Planctomycetota bacterium]
MPEEKDLIRAHAEDLHPAVERQLRDGRYRWIAFTAADLDAITGSLSYVCNRAQSRDLVEELDGICTVLERHLRTMDCP